MQLAVAVRKVGVREFREQGIIRIPNIHFTVTVVFIWSLGTQESDRFASH
jgi:hypothetical protein